MACCWERHHFLDLTWLVLYPSSLHTIFPQFSNPNSIFIIPKLEHLKSMTSKRSIGSNSCGYNSWSFSSSVKCDNGEISNCWWPKQCVIYTIRKKEPNTGQEFWGCQDLMVKYIMSWSGLHLVKLK